MQPIGPKEDHPKAVALVVGIVVALVFIIGSVQRFRTQAGAQGPAKITASTAGPAAAPPGDARATRDSRVSISEGGTPAPNARRPTRDPFHPLAPHATADPREVEPILPSPRAGSGSATWPISTAAVPALPGGAGVPGAAEHNVSGPSVAPGPLLGAVPSVGPNVPGAALPSVALIGTVGEGRTALAAFRVGAGIVHVRSAGTIAGWRVVRISRAHVWLSRGGTRRQVGLGHTLTAGTP
jgi:hypothetical protein